MLQRCISVQEAGASAQEPLARDHERGARGHEYMNHFLFTGTLNVVVIQTNVLDSFFS